MLSYLELEDIGPAPRLCLKFAPRVNVLTGDNGLGKSFLLDIAWWTLTQTWAGDQPWPSVRPDRPLNPRIRYRIEHPDWTDFKRDVAFEVEQQRWGGEERLHPPGVHLSVYARVDGSFSVFDPVRNYHVGSRNRSPGPPAYHFSAQQIWDGLSDDAGKTICNGLIRDWVYWQASDARLTSMPDDKLGPALQQREIAIDRLRRVHLARQAASPPFALLELVLESLSPHPDREPLRTGPPTRVGIDEARDIPTIQMPYGLVPVTLAAAGMKRILGLAYLLVWAFHEHQIASRAVNRKPVNQLVMLVDEIETHLHPQWQRRILPALLAAISLLDKEITVQLIITTHAPLVLASLEPHFSAEKDKLFLLELRERQVHLEELDLLEARRGDAVGWLTSRVFGLAEARSVEAEAAILAAEAWMRGERTNLPESLRTQDEIHRALLRTLPDLDPFWPRWIVHTQRGAA